MRTELCHYHFCVSENLEEQYLSGVPSRQQLHPTHQIINVKAYIQVSGKSWMIPISLHRIVLQLSQWIAKKKMSYAIKSFKIAAKSISCLGIPTYILTLYPFSSQNHYVLRQRGCNWKRYWGNLIAMKTDPNTNHQFFIMSVE